MTFKKSAPLFLVSISVLALAACETTPKMTDAQYWQRKSASSALYLRGPKAQQTLHQDIATCVNEISEFERIAPIRKAIPAETQNGRVPDKLLPDGRAAGWDSPKRDGYLYAEHFNYTDFESCMDYKGWERVEALPYAQATQARQDYLKTVHGHQSQNKQNVSAQATSEREEKPASGYQSSPNMRVND